MRCPVSAVTHFAATTLTRAGLSPEHAQIIASVLVDADLRGKGSHGISRLPVYVRRIRAGGIAAVEPVISRDEAASMVWDARNAAGQVVGVRVMAEVERRARSYGMAVAVVRNSSHLGHLGYFAAMAARDGLVGGCMSNASPRLAAWGGTQAVLGNNPWAAAFPRFGGSPVVVDMANSAVAAGKIREAARKGEPIPPNWALDARGKPTTDPQEALKGILLPMAGAKGYGIALAVSLLTAGLAEGRWDDRVIAVDDAAMHQGMSQVFWALDPDRFTSPGAFPQRVDEVVKKVVASGVDVRVPGERGAALAEEQRQFGLQLGGKLVEQLESVALELGIPFTLRNEGDCQ